jgi:hypothetical protein
MLDDTLRAPPDPLRASPDDLPATYLPPAPPTRAETAHPTCVVCGVPLRGRRPEARCCGGRCRAALSRQIRGRELAARLERAEAALCEAAGALRELQEFAVALGVPLGLGPRDAS